MRTSVQRGIMKKIIYFAIPVLCFLLAYLIWPDGISNDTIGSYTVLDLIYVGLKLLTSLYLGMMGIAFIFIPFLRE
jgi:hypothetical protein